MCSAPTSRARVQNVTQVSDAIKAKRAAGEGGALDMRDPYMNATATVIYCSRTHTQLLQVARELKRTAYADVRATVLGSRDQMCVNSRVTALSGAAQRVACDAEVANGTCRFRSAHSHFTDAADRLAGVADIEDVAGAILRGASDGLGKARAV